ncbi:MAG: CehA/McbA family metallohydrolase [Sandaracinaceae bacterium]|nr:CehA/McbA family metallohydrolase [Sandaracinaceae bacterium]
MRTALALLLLASCTDPAPPTEDAGPPPPTTCDTPPTIELGDADGHPEPLGAAPGEARAGRLASVPDDPSGLLRWAAGDFVLANDRVALVIEDVGTSDEMNPYGGQPIGAASIEDGALAAPADFSELIFTLGRATIGAEHVTVIADGRDGGPAVVRASGPVRTIGFLGFLDAVIPGDVADLEAALDYSLSPDAEHVDVHLRLANATASALVVRRPFLFAFQQNRMPKFGPALGFDVPVGTELPFAVFVEDGATSYGFEPAAGTLDVFIEQANLLGFLLDAIGAEACAVTDTDLGDLRIGGPGLDGWLDARARSVGETRHAIRGVVHQSDGAPAAGARVHAERDGAYLGRATADATGAFELHVGDADVTLTAWRRGDAPSATVAVTAPADGVELTLGPTATLALTIVDETGAPLPARVQLLPVDGDAFGPPGAWGERPVMRGRTDVRYPADGSITMRVPATPHRVVVSHGFEHEIAVLDVDLADGESATREVTLARVLETPGVMCGDLHLHTNRSFDAEDDATLKVLAAAAEGLEIPLRSDHEWVGTFEPEIAALGLESRLFGVGSLELTTFVYGHAGVFPLDADPSARNAGAVDWVDLDPPTVFGDAASRMGSDGRATVIINHPRDFGALLGYFNAANYDPTTGTAGRPEWWYDGFTLLEVFNDSDFDANADASVRDWFSLLSHGHTTFAVGSSDSHEVAGRPVGYPRTCVDVGVDSAEAMRALGAGVFRDRLLAGAATIVGGVFVEPVARGGVGPGGTVSGAGARETIEVTVRAAPWVGVDRLRVFVDGELTETLAIDASTEDPLDPVVRFRAPLEVAVDADAYVVFVADGEGDLEPVYRGRRPFGVTNPIFLVR